MTCQGGGSLEIYLEPVIPKPELLIVGRSPVAEILVGLGRMLDFKVTVADPEATPEQFPEADLVLADLQSARARINSECFVVIATMGNGDEEGLDSSHSAQAPDTRGLSQAERRRNPCFNTCATKARRAEDLDRVKCPAGLELGSETLPEIALSVMAEIIRLRRATPEQTLEPAKASKGKGLPVIETAVIERAVETVSAGESLDPICGMMVETSKAKYKSVHEEKTFYFCCLRCKETFDRSPHLYLKTTVL